MIKKCILSICLISSIVFAEGSKEHKLLPYDDSVSLLKKIHNDAIELGSGEKLIYVFIDPLCKHSRKFITMVSKNPKMLSKYQYRLFLYSIPRLKSTDAVAAIYTSESPIDTLLEIMVEKKTHTAKGNGTTKAKVDRIATVAQEIDVYKRPYIYIMK